MTLVSSATGETRCASSLSTGMNARESASAVFMIDDSPGVYLISKPGVYCTTAVDGKSSVFVGGSVLVLVAAW